MHWISKEDHASHIFLKEIISSFSYYSSSCHKLTRPTTKELAESLFATVIGTSALYSKMLANVFDYYLNEDLNIKRMDLMELLKRPSGQVGGHISDYIAEALREYPSIK